MEAELTTFDISIVETEWLRELLMNLFLVEKSIHVIPMNCDHQSNRSKDNMKSLRHVKTRLKSIIKMRNSRFIHWIISIHLEIWQISS
jgi:hypothetical protein